MVWGTAKRSPKNVTNVTLHVISLITATNVALSALGPIFLMYMFIKPLSGEKSNNFYQRDFTSTTFSNLKSHLKTYIGEQRNKCNLCNYAVSETRDLSRHLATHSGEKPHKCYLCKYSAFLEGILKQHMKIYHQRSILTYSTYHKLPW